MASPSPSEDSIQRVPRRSFLRRAAQLAVGAPALLGVYAWRIEPHWVEVVHRELPIARLPLPLEGQTLVQVSDLHVGPVVDDGYLRSALHRVRLTEPAAVVMTGDWMTCEDREQVDKTISIARELQPDRTRVIAILGNHDYGKKIWLGHVADELTEKLQKVGVEVLRNECTECRGLQVAGIDDLWARRCRVRSTISMLDPQRASIVLAHNPDTSDLPAWENYQGWILSGHTHGGQCWGPGIGAPVLPVENPRYAAGEVDLGDGRRLYVNRALGYKQRVRLMVRPEITVFRLTRDAAFA